MERVAVTSGIEVVDYDLNWPRRFDESRVELVGAFGPSLQAIEHLGSTSVPGLAAKPVIDIYVSVADLDDVRGIEPALRELGYRPVDFGVAGRLYYVRRRGGVETDHLHVIPAGRFDELNQRLLRDWLLAHPEDVRRYGELKRRLAADGDRAAYTRCKTGLIQELVDAARAERGLPSAPVWES